MFNYIVYYTLKGLVLSKNIRSKYKCSLSIFYEVKIKNRIYIKLLSKI